MASDPLPLVLVVEDSDEHYVALSRAFKKVAFNNPVRRCADGDEALDYLFQRGEFADPADAPRPGLVLLDLNLPGTDGREVLEFIKRDPGLRTIPVVVLTTSSNPADVSTCYRGGASSYVIKPVGFAELIKAVESLKCYWFDVVALPED